MVTDALNSKGGEKESPTKGGGSGGGGTLLSNLGSSLGSAGPSGLLVVALMAGVILTGFFLYNLYKDISYVCRNPQEAFKSPYFYALMSVLIVAAVLLTNPVGWGLTGALIAAGVTMAAYLMISNRWESTRPANQSTDKPNGPDQGEVSSFRPSI